MHILITGGLGQLGRALQEALVGEKVTAVDLPEVDICDRTVVERLMADHQFDVAVNCAAFTNVDGCVSDYPTAHRINAYGPMVLAQACRSAGIPMVQISSNEVFDGRREDGYEEWMPLNPINPYGMSKAAGEFNVRSILQEHYIVRTAWLFAPGGRNFVHAILRRARDIGSLRVVADEIGNPTYAPDLARAIVDLIRSGSYGTYHFVNEGACSRWEFANEILRAANLGEVDNEAITSDDFDRASTPPEFGELHNRNGAAMGIVLRPWQEALREFLDDGFAQ